jgi:hypothetical protein
MPLLHPQRTPAGLRAAARRPGWLRLDGAGRALKVGLAFAAVGLLAFLGGAATMHFRLPPSDFLHKAFRGGEDFAARAEAEHGSPTGDLSQARVVVDRSDATFDGFTLVTSNQAAGAKLLDMRGRVVHEWKMAERRPWPAAQGVGDPLPSDGIHWEKCLALSDGDVLALCCTSGGPYGYGLARFDKNSRLRWGYGDHVHHDFDVGDDGRVYLLTHEHGTPPPAGVDWVPGSYLADQVVVLSAEGKLQKRIPVLEAFTGTPYSVTVIPEPDAVWAGSMPGADGAPPSAPRGRRPPPQPGNDVLHTNSVKCLPAKLAGRFPLFKAGQLLLSLRTPNVLAVLDPDTGKVVWAARGPWQAQHDARFLDNGRLMVFDNLGAPKGSRVLEYDPSTQGIAWSYAGTSAGVLDSKFRGCNQRLPNGNTLVVDPEHLSVVEVTAKGEVVWRWSAPVPPPPTKDSNLQLNLTSARRYAPAELSFLEGVSDVRAR